MITYSITPTTTICPSCAQYPCVDGTGCIGTIPREAVITLVIGASLPTLVPFVDLKEPRPAREPRDQVAPRSIKRGFRKGRR